MKHQTHGASPAPPSPATVLRHCRCQDCAHWSNDQGACCVLPFRRYVPREDYHPAMRRFWSDLGMIRPDQWHYCARYHGPQISKDVWVWPKAKKKGPAPGGGGPSSGPAMAEPAGGTDPAISIVGLARARRERSAGLRRRSAQVGAGSKISVETEQPDEDEVLI
ncbi:MAG TPA: hypothetical protein VNA25_01325 [Phycisphaerae bacterium]|nr:hypothetical protein [Phycisphaerae bacterium]